jgi:Cysteine rich repeat
MAPFRHSRESGNPGGNKLLRERPLDPRFRGGDGIALELGVTMSKKVLTIGVILLLSTSGAMAQMRPDAMAAARPCKPDIAQFCSQVAPGQDRIKACMKEHLPELSEQCKEALFQAWLCQ